MKRISIVFLVLLMFLTGCTNGSVSNTTQTPAGITNTSPAVTGDATPTVSESPDIIDDSVYGEGYNMNMLVSVDEWGRTVEPIIGKQNKREVGIFYWMWQGTQSSQQIYDSSKIAAMPNGIDILLRQDTPVSPAGVEHWWGEPLYGYYSMEDEYIIRKHMELLSYAGVDFIVLEATNSITYKTVALKVMKVLSEMMGEGWNVPKITYYTHTCSIDTINKIYKEIYKRNKYPETWYRIDGKPLMIGVTDPKKDRDRSRSQASWLSNYDPKPLSDEIMNFFYFRRTVWVGCDPVTEDGWPWLEWTYPQPVYGNLINVSVASHSGGPFSLSLSDGVTNWGRGWSFTDKKNDKTRALQGSYFDAQWDTVYRFDPEIVFVGGWNEWYIGKGAYNNEYILWDNVSMEYSRDIEMMKGGYNDAYLIQLAQKIRKYKNLPYTDHKPSVAKTVDINGSASQWEEVNAVYRKMGTVNFGRDYQGAVPSLHYTSPVPKNSLQEVKVTNDAKNIYFYIRCDGNITPYSGSNWMNLFIGKGTPSLKGWNSYEYVLNRSVKNGVSTIEKLDKDFKGTQAGQATLTVQDNIMQIAIPRTALGLSETDNNFYFKVADSVENPSDIMDYYVSGRCMPMGRWSYQYFG